MIENLVVLDVGSSSVKAGYCGEDVPSTLFPSITGKRIKNQEVGNIDFLFEIVFFFIYT